MSDDELIDRMQQIRAQNNVNWMDLVRLAFRHAPLDARRIMQDIARLDGEVRRLTEELAR